MPADGISLPPKGGTSARPAGAGSKIMLHQPCGWAEGESPLGARTAQCPLSGARRV